MNKGKNSNILGCFLALFVGLLFEELILCDALRNLVLFLQFSKREKHPWWSVIFSKIALVLIFFLSSVPVEDQV